VVFLARGPGFEPGSVEEQPIHLADVYATFLGAADLEPESWVVGVDLRADREKRVLSASLDPPSVALKVFREEVLDSGALDPYRRALWAAVGPRYKMIVGSDGTREIYDLQSDPEEARPLDAATLESRELAELRAVTERARRLASVTLTTGGASPLDEETEDALRELGYLK
jgi:arylsulfatase A-like enzyme